MTQFHFFRKQKEKILLEVQLHQEYQGDLEHLDCRLIPGNPKKDGKRQRDHFLGKSFLHYFCFNIVYIVIYYI